MGFDVDTLHAAAVGEGDGAAEHERIEAGGALAGERGIAADGIEGAERGDVIHAEGEGRDEAEVGEAAADDVQGMHEGPVLLLLVGGLRVAGEDVVIQLRPADAEHAAEGAQQLVLHLQQFVGGAVGDAAAVEDEDGVGDQGGIGKGVDGFSDGMLAAAGGVAGAGAEERVGDGAVVVVDDSERGAGTAGGDVCGHDDAGVREVDVGAVDVFSEGAVLRDGRGWRWAQSSRWRRRRRRVRRLRRGRRWG